MIWNVLVFLVIGKILVALFFSANPIAGWAFFLALTAWATRNIAFVIRRRKEVVR